MDDCILVLVATLPRLRLDLDFMPSPVEDRPGLLIRDPFQYSDATLIIPPPLVPFLEFFDGERSGLDLRAELVRLTGELRSGELADHLIDSLTRAAFLDDETFAQRKDERQKAFAGAPSREAIHAGSAYPGEKEELSEMLVEFMGTDPSGVDGTAPGPLVGIAAPHVSPTGGWECYRDAYRALTPDLADRTFVVLGTSHYGAPGRLGLTRKPFVTPFGKTQTATELVDRIEREAGAGVLMEDYCHAVEHSIEFQVIFLQHIYGPQVRVLPILCGSFTRSLLLGGQPEDEESVKRLLGALGDLAAAEGNRLFWVLGVDMAHVGHRYGDHLEARANEGEMTGVASRDRDRIMRIESADARGFWELVRENQDDLKWCGSAPIYAFLRAVPSARGKLGRYQQWNIDDQSVVSFAAMSFRT